MAQDKLISIPRAAEIHFILDCIADAECCAVVGLSNMGKSALLRSVAPVALHGVGQIKADEYVFVYIDFNLMIEMSEQAFYELILRSARVALQDLDVPHVQDQLEDAYQKVIHSSNPFLAPLGFNEGVMGLCEGLSRRVVLLCDEFDEPFTSIEQRVFLNLRALKDRYDRQLCYVVATGKQLEEMRHGAEIGEFCELFAHQRLFLGPLNQQDMRMAMAGFLEGVVPTARDVDFVWDETGGHPGLLEAVCYALIESGIVGGQDDDKEYGFVRDKLDSDLNVRGECAKLWNGLNEKQREVLIEFVSGKKVEWDRIGPLVRNGILRRVGQEVRVFGALFSGFVRRQRLVKKPYPPGVRVDVDSGDVWVDGERVPALTDLEYRLMLLLYGRMGKLCGKYQIVEAVWGEDYIDQVDDARIEKLVSRLRKKIEPDLIEPRYLQTVRGRGYRLVEG